jgi:hypothetical protein
MTLASSRRLWLGEMFRGAKINHAPGLIGTGSGRLIEKLKICKAHSTALTRQITRNFTHVILLSAGGCERLKAQTWIQESFSKTPHYQSLAPGLAPLPSLRYWWGKD